MSGKLLTCLNYLDISKIQFQQTLRPCLIALNVEYCLQEVRRHLGIRTLVILAVIVVMVSVIIRFNHLNYLEKWPYMITSFFKKYVIHFE